MRRRSGTTPFQLFSFQDIITSVMGIVVLVLLVLALELSQRQLRSPAAVHASVRQNTSQTLDQVAQEVQVLRTQLAGANLEELAAISPSEVATRQADVADALERLHKEESEKHRRVAKMEEQLRQEATKLKTLAKEARVDQQQRELRKLEQELEQWRGKKRIVYRTSTSDGKQAWIVELGVDEFLVAQAGKTEPPLKFEQPEIDDRREALLAWSRKLSPQRHYLHFLVKPGASNAFAHIELSLRAKNFALGFDLLPSDQSAIDPETGAGTDT